MSGKSVFISHSSKDDGIVLQLRHSLERLQIGVWADSQQLTGGDPLTPRVTDAIGKASHFIAILSVNAINSPWVRKEIDYALGLGKKVIPVLLPGIEASGLGSWFREEPVGIKIMVGPGGLSAALPKLLAALEDRLPREDVANPQAGLPPIADLVLELSDPEINTSNGVRRATATAHLNYSPADGGPTVRSPRYTFTAPLGPIEADDLTWYLERYINWPSGVFQDRAREIEAKLPRWGRALFDTLNTEAARNALHAWNVVPAGMERSFTVKLDLDPADKLLPEASEAATLLLALPWELIHDGQGYMFMGARGARVRRSLTNRNPQPPIATPPPIRVLLVSSRPEDKSARYIDHRVSARPVIQALTELGELAEFKVLDPPTFPALQEELGRADYHVVHFDGHGVYDRKHGLGALCFEDPADEQKIAERRSKLVTADKIAEVIRGHRVPLFFLEACQTAMAEVEPSASVAAHLLESGVASVAAMSHSVLVETARRFVSVFYSELLSGKRVGQAMLAGQRALKMDTFRGQVFTGEFHLEDWFVPVLFQEEQDPQLVHEMPAEQVRAIAERGRKLALGQIPEAPEHEFVGRSRELLAAERLLGRGRYVVLQGAGGEGKTTMAAELARWLVFTRRFARGAFVALDQAGDARKMVHSIGSQLMPNYAARAGQDEKLEWQLVEHALEEHATVIVIDNMESVLAPPAGSEAAAVFEPETLKAILDLSKQLAGTGRTRLIFTSREPLPAPFASNVLKIGRLGQVEAIQLVSQVLGKGKLMPHAADSGESESEVEALVEAVGCQARSLVLLAREVVASGVRRATKQIHELMATLEAKHPGDRERSLLASVELSLRRLPVETRQRIRALTVFHGGAYLGAIAMALGIEPEQAISLARELENVGMAELGEFGYVQFDPALLGGLEGEAREAARAAWAEAMAAEVGFLYELSIKHASFSHNLALLDLANLLAALEYLAAVESPERVIDFATSLEGLIANLNRPKALARVVEIRTEAGRSVMGWGHVRYIAESPAVDRLIEQGRHDEAVLAARSLYEKTQAAGETVYYEAAHDGARAQFMLGRALWRSGSAEEAVSHLEEARRRFERLGHPAATVALADKASCLSDLGRYDEATKAYEETIRVFEQLGDVRGAAVGKGQLATLRRRQNRYADALELYVETRKTFQKLGEPGSVAGVWHLIAMVHERTRQYDAAEAAYQESLKIRVQIGDRAGEAASLNQLGNLYSCMERLEEAVRFYRQAAEMFAYLRDLRNEGVSRGNVADKLVKLNRYAEARVELGRAIECKKPFGHVAEPWTTFDILADLEREVGNPVAAQQARHQAIQAYLSYRRAGGASQAPCGERCALVIDDPNGADLPAWILPLASAIQAVLAGSRDVRLADDANISYADAAELLLLIETLPRATTA
jgi:tetratricopeptide (TPR) repeat protein